MLARWGHSPSLVNLHPAIASARRHRSSGETFSAKTWFCLSNGWGVRLSRGCSLRDDMNEKYQLAIIGTGSGGSEAALLAARRGLKVIAVETGAIGGTRIHHGAYAVRALHATANLHSEFFKDRRFQSSPDLSPDSRMQALKAQRVAR